MNSRDLTQPSPPAGANPLADVQQLQSRRGQPGLCALALGLATATALANGGPFTIKYPGGDPAAKGVLARLDPDLKPARESRLQVVKEDLAIRFEPEPWRARGDANAQNPPLVAVTATYLITNTTAETVEVDFGFPILRGIYISPYSMIAAPDATVRVSDRTTNQFIRPTLISNSAIYGLLRQRAAAVLHRALVADAELQRRFDAVRAAAAEAREPARQVLADYLTSERKWSVGDARLLVEYAALQPATVPPAAASNALATSAVAAVAARPRFSWGIFDDSVTAAMNETAWAASAIGEQKATQWLTRLAGWLEPASAASYEAVFHAWGGDVRERAVDLKTGQVRPREISLEASRQVPRRFPGVVGEDDPTVYARVDYLDAHKQLTEEQRASWQAVLKHLPVVFTFAPMNLLHYRVAFAPGAVRTVAVSYRQYASLDTAAPHSYQIAYVVHPASLWDAFGPIHLTVTTPEGVMPVSALPFQRLAEAVKPEAGPYGAPASLSFRSFAATLTDKRGELFVGINADDWKKATAAPDAQTARVAK